jgi:hypothetical protein
MRGPTKPSVYLFVSGELAITSSGGGGGLGVRVVALKTCLKGRFLKRRCFRRDNVSRGVPVETLPNRKKSTL